MSKKVKSAVLLGILLSTPHCGWSQDSEFPTLNSIGRFWGVGYTRGGYHAAQDGRFDIITSRHPASDYRRGGLPTRDTLNYSPAAQWSPPSTAPIGVTATPTQAPPLDADKLRSPKPPASPAKTTPSDLDSPSITLEAIPSPEPVIPAKPTEPPPAWLQEYLQDEGASSRKISPPSRDAMPADLLEISPSDLQFDESETGTDTERPEAGKETGFSILDASYPHVIAIEPGREALYAAPPSLSIPQKPAPPRFNRYRR